MPHLATTAKVNISQVDVFKVLADPMFEVLGINLRARLGFWVKLKLPVTCFNKKWVQVEEMTPTMMQVPSQDVGMPSVW